MTIIDTLITDRTSSDVSRWSELKSKGWAGMTEAEKAEWSAGMKGAYKYTDLNRVNEALVYLQNRLRGYGYLVDVVLPVIEEVEPGTSRLPDGYQEVEYIQSSGTQYVDTGFKPNQDTRIVLKYNATAEGYIAGCENEWKVNSFDIYTRLVAYGDESKNFSNIFGTEISADFNKNVYNDTSGRSASFSYSQFSSNLNLYLFAINRGGSPTEYFQGSLLNLCTIYDNGSLVRDFVPAKNSDGTVGLYDLVNDAFYGNAGTGTFTAGPDVGSTPVITTRPYWAEGDIPTQSQMEQYLQNVSNIRAVLEVLQTTPPVPSDMVGLTFGEANDIERILVDVETVINRVVAGFFRSNAFTVICGNRPLPSAQSDLGRTWDDIDAEDLTWDDLDDHGSSWYVIQYGVLKGTAVGIL